MINNYFKIAWRTLWKDKFYSAINVLGLSIAAAAFLLVMNYVRFEKSYEDFHINADNIFRLTLDLYKGSEYVVTDCETYAPLGPALKSQMPEVVNYVRVQDLGACEISSDKKSFLTEKTYAADPTIFSVFTLVFIKGDRNSALTAPNQAVITETIAKKIFGNTNVIGKTLKLNAEQVVIAGVIEDVPQNTHLKFDFLIPFNAIQKLGFDLNSWGGNNNYTYLQMAPHTNLAAFNRKLMDFSKGKLKNEIVTAEPIKNIHLYSHKTFEPDVNGDAKTVNFLSIISFLIILTGAVNYINLTTARSAERTKEVGIRKILGSSRTSLLKHFFTESLVINVLSLILAIILIRLFEPFYSLIIGQTISKSIFSSPAFWIMIALLFISNNLLSGVYPAFVFSSVKPASVTVRNFTGSLKGKLIRKSLVVGQFTIALIVLSTSIIIYQQLYFVRHQNLGLNMNEVLIVKGPTLNNSDSLQRKMGQAFKNELLNVPGIKKVALAGSLPGLSLRFLNTQSNVTRYGEDASPGYNYYLYGIDANFIPAMQINLVAGHNFISGFANKDEVIINEEASRLLGFKRPEEAIGQKIKVNSGPITDAVVVAVIKNYHQQSLKGTQLPMIHWYSEDPAHYYALKINSANIHKTISDIKKVWQKNFSGHAMEYYFLDDMFNEQYKSDIQFGKIINVFSVFTLFITCLGLLGLTAYNTLKRTKEIGIRKVLGASAHGIAALLSRDFLKPIGIAMIIAMPLSWFIMNKWLQSFAFRISISLWIFLLTDVVAILFAIVTVSFQSIKAALANPVKSLRTE